MGPSPYGGPESDTTEQLSTTQIHFTGRDLNLRGRDAFFSLFFFLVVEGRRRGAQLAGS